MITQTNAPCVGVISRTLSTEIDVRAHGRSWKRKRRKRAVENRVWAVGGGTPGTGSECKTQGGIARSEVCGGGRGGYRLRHRAVDHVESQQSGSGLECCGTCVRDLREAEAAKLQMQCGLLIGFHLRCSAEIVGREMPSGRDAVWQRPRCRLAATAMPSGSDAV